MKSAVRISLLFFGLLSLGLHKAKAEAGITASSKPIPNDVTSVYNNDGKSKALGESQLSAALAPESKVLSNNGQVMGEPTTGGVASMPVSQTIPEEPVVKVKSLPPRSKSVSGDEKKFVTVDKPRLIDQLQALVMSFKQNVPAEPCQDIVTDMEMNESTITAARAMTVLLGRLDTDTHEGAGESISTDKECHNALLTLSDAMVDRDASNDGSGNQNDLITFMDRIVRCKANVEEDRTILQQIVYLGLEKSLKSSFTLDLLKGSSDYNSVDYLDSNGNSLLHLAVLSGAHHLPTVLCTLIDKMNAAEHGSGPAGIMTGAWWGLSALLHQNKEGFKPLQLCKTSAMSDLLKRHFRTITAYFQIKYRRSFRDSKMAEINSMLKSSTSQGGPLHP